MSNKTKRANHPISNRQFKQIICRTRALAEAMVGLVSVSWRPGDQSGSFLGKVFRPLGSPLLVVQHSEFVQIKGRPRERVHLLGYKAEIDPFNGDVYFGGEDRNVFAYDFGLRPHVGAKGRILDPKKNPSLGYLGLEMDKIRQNYAERSFSASALPLLPRVYLGFSEDRLPTYEDTPMLRARVAKHMRKHVVELESMGDEALQPFLQAEWSDCFVKPGEGGNDTHLHLINHELCSKVSQALRIYECFDELLGAEIYNPARELISPRKAIANPTVKVAKKLGVDVDLACTGSADEDAEAGIKLEKGVRESLGANGHLFSTDDIVNMLLNPGQPMVPSGLNDLKDLGDENIVELMKEAVGRHSDACTDEDLIEAAHNPGKALYARGLCGVSVCRFDVANRADALKFGPEKLKRQRTHVDLAGMKPYWSAGSRRRERKPKDHVVTS